MRNRYQRSVWKSKGKLEVVGGRELAVRIPLPLAEVWEELQAEVERLTGEAGLQILRAKVNLIPYNGGPELPFKSSPMRRVMAFQDILVARDIPAYIRISRGQDVRAACGQLSLAGIRD